MAEFYSAEAGLSRRYCGLILHRRSQIARFRFDVPSNTSSNWIIVPIADLSYLQMCNKGFAQTGAGMLNLSPASSSGNHLNSVFGVELGTSFVSDGTTIGPRASFAWRHEFLDTSKTNTYARAGSLTQFSMITAKEGRDKLAAAAGVDLNFTHEME